MKPIVLVLSLALSACAFFEEPVDGLGSVVLPGPSEPAAPVSSVPVSSLPSVPVSSIPSGSTSLPPAPSVESSPAPQLPASAPAATSSSGTYFAVATLFDVPESAQNLSFIHFTDRNPRRERAACRALLEQYAPTAMADVPANASNLIVWPVSGTVGSTCDEMLSSYEAIDISNKTAENVSSDAAGPFMLSRNNGTDRRLIFDLSEVNNRSLGAALSEWQTLIDGPTASWPIYRSAR